jgi:hypothetical protein
MEKPGNSSAKEFRQILPAFFAETSFGGRILPKGASVLLWLF